MSRSRRSRWAVALLVAALLGPIAGSQPAAASLEDTTKASQRVLDNAFDLVVLRPLSVSALVVGSVFFVVSAPFVAPMGFVKHGASFDGLQPAYNTFVFAPYEYAVLRDLGEL